MSLWTEASIKASCTLRTSSAAPCAGSTFAGSCTDATMLVVSASKNKKWVLILPPLMLQGHFSPFVGEVGRNSFLPAHYDLRDVNALAPVLPLVRKTSNGDLNTTRTSLRRFPIEDAGF